MKLLHAYIWLSCTAYLVEAASFFENPSESDFYSAETSPPTTTTASSPPPASAPAAVLRKKGGQSEPVANAPLTTKPSTSKPKPAAKKQKEPVKKSIESKVTQPIMNNEGYYLPANLSLSGVWGMFLHMVGTVMSFMYTMTVLPNELNSVGIGSWPGLAFYLLLSAGLAMTLWKTELPKTIASLKDVWSRMHNDYSREHEEDKHRAAALVERYQRAAAGKPPISAEASIQKETAAVEWEATTKARTLRYMFWAVCLGVSGLVALITLTRVVLRVFGVLFFLGIRFWYWNDPTPPYTSLTDLLTATMTSNPLVWAGNMLSSPANVMLCAAIGPMAKTVIQYIRLEGDPELANERAKNSGLPSNRERRELIKLNYNLYSDMILKIVTYGVLFYFGKIGGVLLVELVVHFLTNQGYLRPVVSWLAGSKTRGAEFIKGNDYAAHDDYQRHRRYQKVVIGLSLLLSIVFLFYSIGIASFGTGVMTFWGLITKIVGSLTSSADTTATDPIIAGSSNITTPAPSIGPANNPALVA